jgi:hypothetical protein
MARALHIGIPVLLLALFLLALIGAFSGRLSERAPEPTHIWRDEIGQKYLGRTEDEIVAELGKPNYRWEGSYGLQPVRYPGAWSMEFTQPKGSLYISVHKVDDRWICYSASWLPEGARF